MHNQHQLLTAFFKRVSAVHVTTPARLLIIYMGLLTFCAGLCLTANSQRINPAPDYGLRTDTVQVKKIRVTELNKLQKQQSRKYADFLSGDSLGLQPVIYPFYPYIPISFKNLPPPPFRLYLGKVTAGDKSDFVLIAVACKQTGPPGGRKQYNDVLKTTKSGSGLVQQTSWTSIRVRKSSAATDFVLYEQISTDMVSRYINNFTSFVKRKKLDLPRRYPLCFVIRSNKSKKPQMRIQPVLVRSSQVPAASGGTQRWKKYFFQDDRIIIFLGQSDREKGNDNDACCQTPPEGGNSIPVN